VANPKTPALLAAVHADPSELHTRMVYADALSEAGDPRGEFIALQCAGGNTEREHALLAEHGVAWLGRLAPLLDSTVYVCGFLHSAWVKKVPRPKLLASVGDPMWSTVAQLRFDPSIGGVVMKNGPVIRGVRVPAAALLLDPIMRSLDDVRGIDGDVLTTLAREGTQLSVRTIRASTYPLLFGNHESWHYDPDACAVLEDPPGLPKLRDLELHGYPSDTPDMAWLLHAPIAKRLERLRLENFGGSIDQWIAAVHGTPIPDVEIDTARFRGGDDLELDASRFSSWQLALLDAALARVPEGALRRLEVKR
jgi:uncharacterized protein (TIGR02996 family)